MIWITAYGLVMLVLTCSITFLFFYLTGKKTTSRIALVKSFDWFIKWAVMIVFVSAIMFLINQYQAHGAGKVCVGVDRCYSV